MRAVALPTCAPAGGWTLDALGQWALGDAWLEPTYWTKAQGATGLAGVGWLHVESAVAAGAAAELVAELHERVTVATLLPHIGLQTAPAYVADSDRTALEVAGLLEPRLTGPVVALEFRAATQGSLFGGVFADRARKTDRCRTCGGSGRAVAVEAGGKLATPRQTKVWLWSHTDGTKRVTVDCWKCRGCAPDRWWYPHDGAHPQGMEPRGRWTPWVRR